MGTIREGTVKRTLEGPADERLLAKDMYPAAAALANASGTTFGDLNLEGRRLRTVVLPVPAANEPTPTYFLVGAGTLLDAAALGSLVAGRLLNPLRRLREATQVVSHEDLTQRVEVRDGSDDVTLLAKTFNTMLERLDEGARQ